MFVHMQIVIMIIITIALVAALAGSTAVAFLQPFTTHNTRCSSSSNRNNNNKNLFHCGESRVNKPNTGDSDTSIHYVTCGLLWHAKKSCIALRSSASRSNDFLLSSNNQGLLLLANNNDVSILQLPSTNNDDIVQSMITTANAVTPTSSHAIDIFVFVLGVIPFIWATVEFWRRIAVGLPFGTGADSVFIIGEENNLSSSRGRRTLGKGALVVAYILFSLAAGVMGIAFVSVLSPPLTSLP